ncbi:hypothetical protein CBER1_11267 [Cercospora berteroae]|uniref:Oxidase ustYa n=1 Tax=Cercospora berteroae TaxID=357750 RepID=A0A2S6BZV3_9PEZI|nr:hypothetical protein CBER1_11267 [Cercospora berteroae]
MPPSQKLFHREYLPLRAVSPVGQQLAWRNDDAQNIRVPERAQKPSPVGIALLVSGLCNLALGLTLVVIAGSRGPRAPSLAEDVSGNIAAVALRKTVFQSDPRFVSPDSNSSEASSTETIRKAWSSLFPDGRGFSQVARHDADDLPAPLRIPRVEGDVEDVYGMAVFHQLHCLEHILDGYRTLQRDAAEVSERAEEHTLHCFDYLRQAVMCCGDTALEGSDPGRMHSDATHGWGVTHVCKDYGALLTTAFRRWLPMAPRDWKRTHPDIGT